MKVNLDQLPQPSDAANTRTNISASAPASQTSARPAPARPANSAVPEPEKAAERNTATPVISSGTPQTNVTFRRDSAGRIYYVLTDAVSGKELRQVPPEELRKVGEGIDEYLKAQESKASSHVETKA